MKRTFTHVCFRVTLYRAPCSQENHQKKGLLQAFLRMMLLQSMTHSLDIGHSAVQLVELPECRSYLLSKEKRQLNKALANSKNECDTLFVPIRLDSTAVYSNECPFTPRRRGTSKGYKGTSIPRVRSSCQRSDLPPPALSTLRSCLEFAACATGRTVSIAWACRDHLKRVQECVIQ